MQDEDIYWAHKEYFSQLTRLVECKGFVAPKSQNPETLDSLE